MDFSVVLGIDIGSSKIAGVMLQYDEDLESNLVLGYAIEENPQTIKKSKIVQPRVLSDLIKKLCDRIILMAGVYPDIIRVNIFGSMNGVNNEGIVTISNKERVIQDKDVDRVLKQASIYNLDDTYEILHMMPQYYDVDQQKHIFNPLGMKGLRFKAYLHLVITEYSVIQDILQVYHTLDIYPTQGIGNAFANSVSVLSDEEKQQGVLLLDIGADITDIVLFYEGYPLYTKTIPIAGNFISQDLSLGLGISLEEAEKLKKEYGDLLEDRIDPIDILPYDLVEIQKKQFIHIIASRMEEILLWVLKSLTEYHTNIPWDRIRYVVFTGGSTRFPSMIEFAKKIFPQKEIHLGIPSDFQGFEEELQTVEMGVAIGLCKGLAENNHDPFPIQEFHFHPKRKEKNFIRKIFGKTKKTR